MNTGYMKVITISGDPLYLLSVFKPLVNGLDHSLTTFVVYVYLFNVFDIIFWMNPGHP